jgi:hypothetical protein
MPSIEVDFNTSTTAIDWEEFASTRFGAIQSLNESQVMFAERVGGRIDLRGYSPSQRHRGIFGFRAYMGRTV